MSEPLPEAWLQTACDMTRNVFGSFLLNTVCTGGGSGISEMGFKCMARAGALRDRAGV